MKKDSTVIFVVAITTFLIGFGTGDRWSALFETQSPLSIDVRDKVTFTKFTNPLLECSELPESVTIGGRIKLESEVEKLVADAKKSGTISDSAVYFRDLNNGPWFGINEETTFYPASLLKIPLAMWYYWKADSDPSLLDVQIEFTGPPGISIVHFKPERVLVPGTTYTIDELIHFMLQESDNDAAHILYEYMGTDKTNQVYQDLGVSLPEEDGTPTDVKTYAAFFRILYNATYLGRTLSEYMLDAMTKTSFTQGIVAGVPEGVEVSHKFGERSLVDDGSLVQLHDCGIVYFPQSPYLLCVMSQGGSYEDLAGFIADVSRTVYEHVKK